MVSLRRLSSLVGPRRLLAAGAFLFLGYLFANNLSPEDRYAVRTGVEIDRHGTSWATVGHVSDDGERVVLRANRGERLSWDSRLELWDLRAGTNCTPAHWKERAWNALLSGGFREEHTNLGSLLAYPTGREFLHDETAWSALRDRMAAAWGSLPGAVWFSPDGRHCSYIVRVGRPTDGTAVDDLRTGRRVATLPEVVDRLTVAPDGRTAVSRGRPAADGTRRLVLWDLATAARRAELSLPPAQESSQHVTTGQWHRIKYTADGRFVFADSYQPALVRWWDVETGHLVGEIATFGPPGLPTDGQQVVACQPGGPTVEYWPVAGGPVAARWQPDWPAGRHYGGWSFADGGRYAVVGQFQDPSPQTRRSFRAIDRAAEWLSDRLSDRRGALRPQVLVLDVVERRSLGRVPGQTGAVAANGRWVATMDADGLVRVWELPVGRPWARGFAYAAAVVVGVWALGRLWRRKARRQHPTASPVT